MYVHSRNAAIASITELTASQVQNVSTNSVGFVWPITAGSAERAIVRIRKTVHITDDTFGTPILLDVTDVTVVNMLLATCICNGTVQCVRVEIWRCINGHVVAVVLAAVIVKAIGSKIAGAFTADGTF